jgi:hypothetical protein
MQALGGEGKIMAEDPAITPSTPDSTPTSALNRKNSTTDLANGQSNPVTGAAVSTSEESVSVTLAQAARLRADSYNRYHINNEETEDRQSMPNKFLVRVARLGLAKMLLREAVQYWGKWDVVLNRPCVYGVFSGPVGGFMPRPKLCVGCLRCTIQHPEFVRILPNPKREQWADDFVTVNHVETIFDEAKAGHVPVRGQGYRGRFGGAGWDGMWTDMSEIVRPTRDGIHGREFISTAIDIGSKPTHLAFDSEGRLSGSSPKVLTLQVPFLLENPFPKVMTPELAAVWSDSAIALESMAILPLTDVLSFDLSGAHVAPLVRPSQIDEVAMLSPETRMIELTRWDPGVYSDASTNYPHLVVAVRVPFASGWRRKMIELHSAGVRVIHFESDLHGQGAGGEGFVMDLLKEAHGLLVEQGIRDEMTILSSGGIVAAEHVPKAIICGADGVGLDIPLMLALQAKPLTRMRDAAKVEMKLARKTDHAWMMQRIQNLAAAWRDQLLEILGAMGLREVRRLRGEWGRSMEQASLEAEAFGDIDGFRGGT